MWFDVKICIFFLFTGFNDDDSAHASQKHLNDWSWVLFWSMAKVASIKNIFIKVLQWILSLLEDSGKQKNNLYK